jgi:flagellar basal-body rod modification protein FlgD
MEDKEFISQLAQFSSLEEMQGMNQQMEAMGLHVQDMSQLVASSITNNSAFAALNLIGRTIEALDPKDPNGIKTVRGTVDGVKFTDAGPILRVGDMDIPLSKIRSVFQPAD